MKLLFPVNIQTGAIGSGDGAWILSVPRSSKHKVGVGQGPAVLAVLWNGVVWIIFLYRLCSLQLSSGDGSIKTEILPQRTVNPKTTNRR